MAWIYEIRSGRLYDDSLNLVGVGYSGGDKGQFPEAVNDPEYVSRQNIGPIPPGTYSIGKSYTHPILGPVAMDLDPDPANEMYGRSLFRIHGDNALLNHSASDGCIIQSRDVRETVDQSADRTLEVVAVLDPSLSENSGAGGTE